MVILNIPNYTILEEINRGGSGIVYRAKDNTNKIYAIKVLHDSAVKNSELVKQFKSEAKLLQTLSHEGLLRVYNAGFGPVYYMVMEFFQSRNLKKLITLQDKQLYTGMAKIILNVSDTLLYLHLNEIVHRDVKPENILVSRDNRVKLIDLSIALQKKGIFSLFFKEKTKGSPSYMSPEQILNKKIDHRSDIYSFGAVIYEMWTGRPPFEGKNQDEILQKHLTQKPRALSDFVENTPQDIENFVAKALQKNPDDRFPDMNSFIYAFRKISDMFKKNTDDMRREGTRIFINTGMVIFEEADTTKPFSRPKQNRCTLTNISRRGVGFLFQRPIKKDTLLDVVVSIPLIEEEILLRCRVAWAKKAKDVNAYSIGASIISCVMDYTKIFEKIKSMTPYTDGLNFEVPQF